MMADGETRGPESPLPLGEGEGVFPNRQPVPVPASLYSEEIVVGFAGPDYRDFVESGGRQLRPRLARSLDLARLEAGVRLLDLGCGRGEAAVHAALRGARVTAVDYSSDCVRLTREAAQLVGPLSRAWPFRPVGEGLVRLAVRPAMSERGRAAGDEPPPYRSDGGGTLNLELIQADATALPFPDATFDRVTMLDVVEHLFPWQLDITLREVRRVLKPEGFAVIHTVPNRWALHIGYPLLRLVRPSLPADPRTDYERQVHVNEQDPIALRRALSRAGLRSRVWLENLTLEQARWQRDSNAFADVRGATYGLFRRPAVRALARLALLTPLRLIVCNDIYALACRR